MCGGIALGCDDLVDAPRHVVGGAFGVGERVGFGDDPVEAVLSLGPALADLVDEDSQVAVGIVCADIDALERIDYADDVAVEVVGVAGGLTERVCLRQFPAHIIIAETA